MFNRLTIIKIEYVQMAGSDFVLYYVEILNWFLKYYSLHFRPYMCFVISIVLSMYLMLSDIIFVYRLLYFCMETLQAYVLLANYFRMFRSESRRLPAGRLSPARRLPPARWLSPASRLRSAGRLPSTRIPTATRVSRRIWWSKLISVL